MNQDINKKSWGKICLYFWVCRSKTYKLEHREGGRIVNITRIIWTAFAKWQQVNSTLSFSDVSGHTHLSIQPSWRSNIWGGRINRINGTQREKDCWVKIIKFRCKHIWLREINVINEINRQRRLNRHKRRDRQTIAGSEMGQSEMWKENLESHTRENWRNWISKNKFQDACTFGRGSLDVVE